MAPAPKQVSQNPWLLTINQPGRARAYLGNGYIGITASQEGLGRDGTESLPSFLSGYYRNETLAPAPQWDAPDIRIGGQPLSPKGSTGYSQTMDLKRGLLQTRYRWAGKPAIDVDITLFPARHSPYLGVLRIALTPQSDCRLTLGAAPAGAHDCALAVLDQASAGEQAPAAVSAGEIALKGGRQWVLTRFAGTCASTEPGYAAAAARAAEDAARQGYDEVLRRHTAAWAKLWARDITVEGDPHLQQVLNAFRYCLLASVREGRQDSVPPMGLSSPVYQGHIFWDADTWIFPALVPQYPELAKSIVEYRYRMLPAAKENAKRQGIPGADYPWESAATGKETVNGEFTRGRHVNADIALAQWQYYLWTGDRQWLRTHGFPVIRATADYWAAVAKPGADGSCSILHVMGPDENRGPVDNNAWTNAMAQLNLELATRAAKLAGARPDPKWAAVARKLRIPFDRQANRYVQCDADTREDHKQADCELLIYPRRLAMPPGAAAATYDYYKARFSKVGPAMTSSIYAVIASLLGRPEEAGARFSESWEPFVTEPYDLFSEKRKGLTPRTCFVTGLSGSLQSILYGFAGLEPTEAGLKSRPALPPGWKGLRITGIRWHGQTREVGTSR